MIIIAQRREAMELYWGMEITPDSNSNPQEEIKNTRNEKEKKEKKKEYQKW